MPRLRGIPKYRRHCSGQARVRLVDAVTGRKKDILLGKYGTKESRAEYGRIIAQWEAASRRILDDAAHDVSINELALAYIEQHVNQHYRDIDGNPTYDARIGVKVSLKPLRELFGLEPAADFGPLRLKAVREKMIQSGLARVTVNGRIWRIKKMFKWAVENELLPAAVHHGLQAVSGLQRGRTAAPEPEPIIPANEDHVEATLTCLPPVVQTMVKLQRLTGMRPGEVVILRPGDIDQSGEIWFYTPHRHKTAWRGKQRSIAIGPKGKLFLQPYLNRHPEEYCFSPAEAMLQIWQERRRCRKSKVQPSQLDRSKPNPERQPGERYDTQSYGKAIKRACEKAGIPVWHPNQLRHLVAVELRERFGLEVVRATLGHSFKAMSDHYSKAADAILAGKAAAEVG